MPMQISCTSLFALHLILIASSFVSDANFLPYFQLLRLDREAGRPRPSFENVTVDSSPFHYNQSRQGFFSFDNNSYYANFWAFNYNFQILAYRKRNFGENRIEVNLVSEKESKLLQFDENESYHFEGSLLNYPQYSAYGYVKENSMVCIINVPRDNIFIVPASEYDFQSDSVNTIVYRESDSVNYWCSPLRQSSETLKSCSFYKNSGHTQLDPARPFRLLGQEHPMEPQCPKKLGKHCSIWTVAHYSTYKAYGSVLKTVNEILFHIRRVDCWFRATDFLGEGRPTNVGLKPVNITVFTEKSENASVRDVLQDFSNMVNPFCMGLIFLVQPEDKSEGDVICKTPLCGEFCGAEDEVDKKANVAAVNIQMKKRRDWISATVARMVARVFRADDLKDDNSCLLPSHGGEYIMGKNAKFLLEKNNFKFSNCSIRKMKDSIQNYQCLQKDEAEAECGNGIVEKGEVCDCGRTHAECQKKDPCCLSMQDLTPCQLRPMAHCSPFSSGCCNSKCQPAMWGTPCSDVVDECMMVHNCTGMSANCPTPKPRPYGTACHENSRMCSGGTCSVSICAIANTKECLCMDGPENLCFICCLARNQSCLPAPKFKIDFTDTSFKKPAGYPCGLGGICDRHGACLPEMEELKKPATHEIDPWYKRQWYLILIIVIVIVVCIGALLPWSLCKGRGTKEEEIQQPGTAPHEHSVVELEEAEKWSAAEPQKSAESGPPIIAPQEIVFSGSRPPSQKSTKEGLGRSATSRSLVAGPGKPTEPGDLFVDDSDEGIEIINPDQSGHERRFNDALPTTEEDNDSDVFFTARSFVNGENTTNEPLQPSPETGRKK